MCRKVSVLTKPFSNKLVNSSACGGANRWIPGLGSSDELLLITRHRSHIAIFSPESLGPYIVLVACPGERTEGAWDLYKQGPPCPPSQPALCGSMCLDITFFDTALKFVSATAYYTLVQQEFFPPPFFRFISLARALGSARLGSARLGSPARLAIGCYRSDRAILIISECPTWSDHECMLIMSGAAYE